MGVCTSSMMMKAYVGINSPQAGVEVPHKVLACIVEPTYYHSEGEEYPIPQWNVAYWRSFVETAEAILQFPIRMNTPREPSYMFTGVRQSVIGIDEYINVAMDRAKFEQIDNDEPYYAEVPGLPGVWATGRSPDECRANLREVIDGWVDIRKRKGLTIPMMDNQRLAD